MRWSRLSCRGSDANQVRLQLHLLAYNLANFPRAVGAASQRETLDDHNITCEYATLLDSPSDTFMAIEYVLPFR